jgi:intraflagellar transport protein 46
MGDTAGAELPSEVQELFQYVQRYTPVEFALDFKLQPFLPDFIPSLGQVDDQIKASNSGCLVTVGLLKSLLHAPCHQDQDEQGQRALSCCRCPARTASPTFWG